MSKKNYPPRWAATELDPVRCEGSLESLYSFVDGGLDEPEATRLKAHIDGCDSCTDVYRFQVDLKRLVQAKCQSELPDEVRRRVLAALDTEIDS